MKISKHTVVDVTMTGEEYLDLVAMLRELKMLLADPQSMAEQQRAEQVEVMLERLESL